MLHRILFGVLVFLPAVTFAQSVNLTDQSQPYEIIPIEAAPGVSTSFLGALEGFPIMYELQSERAFTLEVAVRQLRTSEPEPFSLIVIRQNDRGGGVQEIGRMNIDSAEWEQARDSEVGLSFVTSPALTESVEPGIYRIEVSSPQNNGRYQLIIGGEAQSSSYSDRLAAARLTQDFFGYNILAMVSSSLIYVPLMILFMVYTSYWAWRRYRLARTESIVA